MSATLDTIQMTKKDKAFLLSLQDILEEKKLDPAELFKKFDANKDNGLDWGEFGKLLHTHCEDLALKFGQSFQHIFKKADQNKNDKLELDEFLAIFKWNVDVRSAEQQQELINKVEQLNQILQQKDQQIGLQTEKASSYSKEIQDTHGQLEKEKQENANLNTKIEQEKKDLQQEKDAKAELQKKHDEQVQSNAEKAKKIEELETKLGKVQKTLEDTKKVALEYMEHIKEQKKLMEKNLPPLPEENQ